MHNVLFSARALRDLDKLESRTRKRIIKKLKEYMEKPLTHARKLTSPALGTYRF